MSISLDSIFAEIESAEYFANSIHFNNVHQFIKFLDISPEIQNLINIIKIDLGNFDILFERIKKLWAYKCDEKEIHPYDHAIAIYLYAIYRSFYSKTMEVIKFIYTNQLRNLWWTYYVYNYVLGNLDSTVTSECYTSQLPLRGITEMPASIDITAIDKSK